MIGLLCGCVGLLIGFIAVCIALRRKTTECHEAWKSAKYWQDKAEEYSADESFYYVGLRECLAEADKLTVFINSRYHGVKPSGQGRTDSRPSQQ